MAEYAPYDVLSSDNLGALLIGLCVSLILCGATIMQGYTYYQRSSNDHIFLKVLATVILTLELLHSIFIIQIVYRFAVELRGYAPNGPNSYILDASVIPESIVTALVHGFFAFRIYKLSGSAYISAICCIMALFRLGDGIALTVGAMHDVSRVPNYVRSTTEKAWMVKTGFIVSAVVDVLIAVSMCFHLKRMTSGEQLKSTSELVDRLMNRAIQTGTVTSVASISGAIAFFIKPKTFIWFSIYMVTAKLYSNSFFASLNIRSDLRSRNVLPLTEIVEHGLEFRGNNFLDIKVEPSGSQHNNNSMDAIDSGATPFGDLSSPENSFGSVKMESSVEARTRGF